MVSHTHKDIMKSYKSEKNYQPMMQNKNLLILCNKVKLSYWLDKQGLVKLLKSHNLFYKPDWPEEGMELLVLNQEE